MNRTLGLGVLLLSLFAASGASCRGNRYTVHPLTPVAFVAPPTLDEVIYTVNAQTNRVQQLHSDSASLSLPGLPALRTTLMLERERRFRLTAKLIGPELDLGSNDELFWFWVRQSPEPVVFYASHQEFATSPTRGMLPVDPLWLIDALGLVSLEPSGFHEGPFPRDDGQVEIRTRIPRPTGEQIRVLVIDSRYGWINEQHLLDTQGATIASARASGHRFYPAAGVSLPHRIELTMPSAELALRIDVSQYSINELYGDPNQMWVKPQFEGYRPINVAAPQSASLSLPIPNAGGELERPLGGPSRSAQQPSYRGYLPLR